MSQSTYYLAPSLLAANFARLEEETRAVLAAGADRLHLDAMDNHYVPQLTVGPLVCQALRTVGITAPIDVHLMASPVDHLIDAFATAGATCIAFHPEATLHVDASLNRIRQHGCQAGLALNPTTDIHWAQYVADKLDMIILMAVNPGFGGQTLIPSIFSKIKTCRAFIETCNPTIRLAVDGGIKTDNIAKIATAGANMFIVGSAIFSQPSYPAVIQAMRQALSQINQPNK